MTDFVREQFGMDVERMKSIIGLCLNLAESMNINPLVFCAEIDYLNNVNRKNFYKLVDAGKNVKEAWEEMHQVNVKMYEESEHPRKYRGVEI